LDKIVIDRLIQFLEIIFGLFRSLVVVVPKAQKKLVA